MKHLILLLALMPFSPILAQDFQKDISTAKTAYSSGKLEETHFALLQALQEIDIRIGQEVLKLLPPQMDTMKVNSKDDNVSGNTGFIGTTIRRTYGIATSGELTIISNSPLMGTLNAFLNAPLIGGMMTDGNSKIIRVQGYKGRLEKSQGDGGALNFSVDIPLNSSLITFKAYRSSEEKVLKMMDTLPLQQIAKLIQ